MILLDPEIDTVVMWGDQLVIPQDLGKEITSLAANRPSIRWDRQPRLSAQL